jgi:hypothetical protein
VATITRPITRLLPVPGRLALNLPPQISFSLSMLLQAGQRALFRLSSPQGVRMTLQSVSANPFTAASFRVYSIRVNGWSVVQGPRSALDLGATPPVGIDFGVTQGSGSLPPQPWSSHVDVDTQNVGGYPNVLTLTFRGYAS